MITRKETLKIIAENIRVERARKKYSQEYLAEQVNISPQHLYRKKKKKVCPTILVIANIALALGISLDTILPLEELKKFEEK